MQRSGASKEGFFFVVKEKGKSTCFISGILGTSFEERLSRLGLCFLDFRRMKDYLIKLYTIPTEVDWGNKELMFTLAEMSWSQILGIGHSR